MDVNIREMKTVTEKPLVMEDENNEINVENNGENLVLENNNKETDSSNTSAKRSRLALSGAHNMVQALCFWC